MGMVEQIFISDGQLACQTLLLIAQFGEPLRVRVQVTVVMTYLQVMLPEPVSQLMLISELREAFGREFQEHVQLRQQFSQRFRYYQQVLLADLQRQAEDPAASSVYALAGFLPTTTKTNIVIVGISRQWATYCECAEFNLLFAAYEPESTQ